MRERLDAFTEDLRSYVLQVAAVSDRRDDQLGARLLAPLSDVPSRTRTEAEEALPSAEEVPEPAVPVSESAPA